MGSLFSSLSSSPNCGIDSIASSNQLITEILYYPPEYFDKNDINNYSGAKLLYIGGTSTVEIKPTINKYPHQLIIFSHGNATDIFSMLDYLHTLSNAIGITMVCYDYPSYGLSKGIPTEQTCVDALTRVTNHYKDKRVLQIGQSLGTGVVMGFVSNNEWNENIMLISPYKSIPRVIVDSFVAESCIANHRFSSIAKIENVICPVKMFHGLQDELILHTHTQDLFDALKNKKFQPTYFDNCDHNNILRKITKEDYEELLK
jgi:hypothetical protein